jgi:hypothetical protein
MVNYFVNDIFANTSGDIEILSNGDIKLADSYETIKNAVNFLVKTDKGQYIPDKRVGCDLGRFMGQNTYEEVFDSMEVAVYSNITKFVLDPTDIQVHAMPIDQNNAGVFLLVGGAYFDEIGNPLTGNVTEVLTYVYPYAEGQPRLINIS